jgi:4-amino-4-deoxy-L-arabinose transferase-like glycosyltransferase
VTSGAGRDQPPASPGADGERRGPPPASVWALVVLQLLLGIGWSLLAPAYRTPDEAQHVDLVLALAGGQGYPGAYDRQVGARVVATAIRANLSRDGTPRPDRDLRFAAGDAPPRTARPSFAASGPDDPTGFGNQMPQHPPAAYVLAASAIRALPEATAFDVQIWLVRVLSALLVAPLPLLCWLTARRLTSDLRVALAAAVLPLTIPQLAHIAGSVSNDGLLILSVGVATVGVAAVLAGDLRARTALLIGGATGLALLTKGFALALPVVIVVAYALAWRRTGRGGGRGAVRAAVGSGTLALGLAAALGGWWYARNVVLYGAVQPEAFPFADLPALPAEPVVDFGYWLPYAASRYVLRFWGQVGWVEVPLPWPLVWLLAALLAAGVAGGLLLRRSALTRGTAAVLLLPLAGIASIVLLGALGLYLRTGVPAGVQGRYLFPALPGLALVAAAGGVALLGRGGRWLAPAALAVGVVAQVWMGVLALTHWYGPAGALGVPLAVQGLAAWAPVPPPLLAAVAAALGVAALVALTAVVLAATSSARLAAPAPGHP